MRSFFVDEFRGDGTRQQGTECTYYVLSSVKKAGKFFSPGYPQVRLTRVEDSVGQLLQTPDACQDSKQEENSLSSLSAVIN